MTIAKDG